jgi:ABC-type nitrate/sulfonate/bicarbonate transport system permease component
MAHTTKTDPVAEDLASDQPPAPRWDVTKAPLAGLRWLLTRYWGVILLVLSWHLYVTALDINRIVIPSPQEVATELVTNSGYFIDPTLSTLVVASVGLIGGMLMGLTLASLSWFATSLRGLLTPVALIIRSVPIVAMIPVLARVFGYEQRTILVITIAISFFPTFVFITSGLRAAPPGSEDLFAGLGARRTTIFFRLAAPSAVPNGLVALRLSAADCILGALIAEFLMGTQGLGHTFQDTMGDIKMVKAWSAVLLATALSVMFFLIARKIEKKAGSHWQY